jgi:hypothetical protein
MALRRKGRPESQLIRPASGSSSRSGGASASPATQWRRPLNLGLSVVAIGILAAVAIDLVSWGPRKSTVAAPAVPVLPERTTTVPPVTVAEAAQFIESNGPVKAKRCELTRLMLLGDGLVSQPDGLRGPLYRSLYSSKMPINFVGTEKLSPQGGGDPSHEGHEGFTLGPDTNVDKSGKPANLSANLQNWLTSAETFPDIIMLTAGTTDIAKGGEFSATAPAQLTALVAKILETMTEVVVIVTELPPSSENATLNAAARAVGDASPTDRVFFASTSATLIAQKFDPATDLDPDGLGFTLTGGRKYARALDNYVVDAIVAHRARKNCLSSSKTTPGGVVPSTVAPPADGFVEDGIVEDGIVEDGFIAESEDFVS